VVPEQPCQLAGLIITVASAAGIFPVAMAPVYATAKSGVVHFTRSVAPRLRKRNIRICALCPQQVDTPMVSSTYYLSACPSIKCALVKLGNTTLGLIFWHVFNRCGVASLASMSYHVHHVSQHIKHWVTPCFRMNMTETSCLCLASKLIGYGLYRQDNQRAQRC